MTESRWASCFEFNFRTWNNGSINWNRFMVAVGWVLGWCELAAGAAEPRWDFLSLVAHWSDYADPGYLSFIDEAKPEVAQVGFYGAHFWSLAGTPHGGGYPAHLPVRGHREGADWFRGLNAELHRRGVKVIGHFNVKLLIGDLEGPAGPRGFFNFYRTQWDEELLGAKPVADPRDFLEVDKLGQPRVNRGYQIGGMAEYWACLNNPNWRRVLEAWVRFGIAQGVDGFIANYFYRHDCHCRYCVDGFREYLGARFSPSELQRRFAITNLNQHTFSEIVGWHEPSQSTPLRREMLSFSQIANKRAFDQVFVKTGRALKPDLILAQWNHLGDFNQISGDERCLLPAELWGRDEDYLWYSTGDAANFTDLAASVLGEATLQCRYLRGAFEDKPFTLGKYESTRIRVAMAELMANGGAPMGFYTNFRDPAARAELVRYYRFLRTHAALYRGNRSQGEVVLLFPRRSVRQGALDAVTRFKTIGKRLLDEHILFDVLPDDLLPAPGRRRDQHVIDPTDPMTRWERRLTQPELSRFQLPPTVRVSASRPDTGDELTLHLVNYNRVEPQARRNPGRGIVDEKPIPTTGNTVNLSIPRGARVRAVNFLTPEIEGSSDLTFEQGAARVQFRVPGFLVYGVVRVQFSDSVR